MRKYLLSGIIAALLAATMAGGAEAYPYHGGGYHGGYYHGGYHGWHGGYYGPYWHGPVVIGGAYYPYPYGYPAPYPYAYPAPAPVVAPGVSLGLFVR